MRALLPLLLALSLGFADAIGAQGSRNVRLLGRFDPGVRCSDVWGYVQPGTGKEYALLASFDGTHVIDCSEPGAPALRGLIPTDNPGSSQNRWRDIKTFGVYAYVVSEAHGGMQIIDLSDPDNPTKVQTWGASLWSSAHNIAMDLDRGIAYACGTSSGTHVIDVATNPRNPTRLVQFGSPYVHDLSVQDGLAHTADIRSNRYNSFDVTNLPSMPAVASITCSGSTSCHSTWPSRDNQILATCHETSGGELIVYDISNPRLPRFLSRYRTASSSAIVHNPMLRDRVCHVSWNTEGYQGFDLSDPANPVRVGFYDTWTGPSSGFEGLWGVYGLQPSGVIYGSDRSRGLFVFKPAATAKRYGQATSGQTTPDLAPFGAAWLGNASYRLVVTDAPASAAGFIAVASARANLALTGLRLNVDLTSTHLLVPITTDARGTASIALSIPQNTPVDRKIYAQAFVQDATGSVGLAATRGLEIEIFGL